MGAISKTNNRYIKSKLVKIFSSQALNISFVLLVIALAAFGIYLLFQQNNLGWLALIPVSILFMLHEWYTYDLKKNPPNVNSELPEDYLNGEVLTGLSGELNLDSIIAAMSKNGGRIFFKNRFLIGDGLLAQAAIANHDLILTRAKELFQSYPTDKGVDGAYLTVAIILQAENKAEILRSVNYSEEEVMAGFAWYAYLVNALQGIQQKQSSGGIARDWASGYTPLLNKFAQNISYSIQYGGTTHRDIFSRQRVVEQMVSVFSSAGRSNIALVGEEGVGKHICVQGLADYFLFGNTSNNLKYTQIYQIDIATLLSTVNLNSLESVLNEIMVEAYHAKNVILFFNNAGQLFGSDNLVDLSSFLQPIIDAGRLRTIFAFTSTQWQYIQRNKPALSAIFNYQAVLPTDEKETISILENEAIFVEHKYKCLFTYQSLKEIYRLALRYGPDVAMPAKAISVMELSAREGSGSIIADFTVHSAIEKSTGIKIGLASGGEKDKLLNLEAAIHERVIGQDRAVKEVVSALKRNRSGVSSSNKPIGTFLFLGPTGVGKTELSKALASAYFGEDSRFVRLDMNEFITQESVHRLVNVGNQTTPTFLDKIKQQPFAVVLLDEIEKAHPDIVNIFLQVLDEGFMTDIDNKQISFKDTIIIATSNAGADFIRQKLFDGQDVDQTKDELIQQLISSGQFKPEFLNRFDEAIIFRPLSVDELKKVVIVLLNQINRELNNQKITIQLSDAAVEWLAKNGHDPAMGARPLRRLMQKTIETIVADKILEQAISPGDTFLITDSMLGEYQDN